MFFSICLSRLFLHTPNSKLSFACLTVSVSILVLTPLSMMRAPRSSPLLVSFLLLLGTPSLHLIVGVLGVDEKLAEASKTETGTSSKQLEGALSEVMSTLENIPSIQKEPKLMEAVKSKDMLGSLISALSGGGAVGQDGEGGSIPSGHTKDIIFLVHVLMTVVSQSKEGVHGLVQRLNQDHDVLSESVPMTRLKAESSAVVRQESSPMKEAASDLEEKEKENEKAQQALAVDPLANLEPAAKPAAHAGLAKSVEGLSRLLSTSPRLPEAAPTKRMARKPKKLTKKKKTKEELLEENLRLKKLLAKFAS